jgi:hypothetical protein
VWRGVPKIRMCIRMCMIEQLFYMLSTYIISHYRTDKVMWNIFQILVNLKPLVGINYTRFMYECMDVCMYVRMYVCAYI